VIVVRVVISTAAFPALLVVLVEPVAQLLLIIEKLLFRIEFRYVWHFGVLLLLVHGTVAFSWLYLISLIL
jgi:hypothetical protein